jgi:F420-dependent oxidoreductase-like protein
VEACVFTEPQQGASYNDLLAVAQTAEEVGFTAFFRSDHFLKMGGVSGLPGPTDAWVTLGGIARETTSIRLGTLVTAATFRLPGPLAISVAQVDDMSGGRVELGIGAGWYEAEHEAYAIPFPSLKERFEILGEQLAIITGMWSTPLGSTFDHAGTHYQVKGSPGLPKPVQSPVPVVIGGGGKRKTASLAARYATEFNLAFRPLESYKKATANVRQTCEAQGRDPDSLKHSIALVACVGKDEAEVQRRAAVIGRDVEELRQNGAAGTPAEVADKVRTFRDAGAQRMYFQILDLADLDHLRLIASEVIPHL